MLSHCHKDHMSDIQDQCFHTAFKNIKNNMVLYTSPLTVTYLKRNKTINLNKDQLIPLEISFPHLLKVNSENYEYNQ